MGGGARGGGGGRGGGAELLAALHMVGQSGRAQGCNWCLFFAYLCGHFLVKSDIGLSIVRLLSDYRFYAYSPGEEYRKVPYKVHCSF